MITPRDIEEKVFSSGIKGYKKEEVDQFLDEIMLDMEALISENRKQKKLLIEIKKELDASKEKENTLMTTLERARLLMNDISASAEKRAEIIVKNAKEEAANIVSEAHDSIESLNEESKTLKANIAGLKIKYKDMLTDELNKLEGRAEDWFNDLREDFFPASMTMPEGNKMESEVANVSENTLVLTDGDFDLVSEDTAKKKQDRIADVDDLDPHILKSADNKELEDVELKDPAVEAGLFSEGDIDELEEQTEMEHQVEDNTEIIDEVENTVETEKTTLSDIVLPKEQVDDSFSNDGTTVVITKEEMNQNLEEATAPEK